MTNTYQSAETTYELDTEDDIETEVASEASDHSHFPQSSPYEPSSKSLGWNVLQHALTTKHHRLLRSTGPVALIVEVPSAEWVEPVACALKRLHTWDVVDGRDGTDRRQHRPDQGNESIGRALSLGRSVVGVSPSPLAHLPSSLVGAADAWIKVAACDAAIKDTIVAATGRRPRTFREGIAIGLGPHDIAAAIRVGESATKAIARLVAAAKARTIVDKEVAEAPAFASLHGFGAAKTWGEDLIVDIAAWRRGEIAFSAISSRVVLASAPGLGKTTFVRSLAQELAMPLFVTSVGKWFAATDGHLNSVIKVIDEVFDAAKVASPAIIFLDEIDAIPNRATLDSKNRDYWVPIITHILLKLDSATSGANSKTIIVAATNHAGLDEALTRPGRLNNIIFIERPDAEAREGILRAHLGECLSHDNLKAVAAIAVDTTGADLADAVKQARRAARVAGRALAVTDLIHAVAPPDSRSRKDRRAVAIHEAGHVVGRLALGFEVNSVSIIERGGSGGSTIGNRPGGVASKSKIEDYIVVVLSGRAAEQALLGSTTTGAGGDVGSDLALAANMAAGLRTSYGLMDTLLWRGPPGEATRIVSQDPMLRVQVDADLKRLFAQALDIVTTEHKAIEAIADRLLRDRHISGDEVLRIVAAVGFPAAPELSTSIGVLL